MEDFSSLPVFQNIEALTIADFCAESQPQTLDLKQFVTPKMTSLSLHNLGKTEIVISDSFYAYFANHDFFLKLDDVNVSNNLVSYEMKSNYSKNGSPIKSKASCANNCASCNKPAARHNLSHYKTEIQKVHNC